MGHGCSGKIMQWVSARGNDAVPSPGISVSAPPAAMALGLDAVPAHGMAGWLSGKRSA